jgi:hypothetical protein
MLVLLDIGIGLRLGLRLCFILCLVCLASSPVSSALIMR